MDNEDKKQLISFFVTKLAIFIAIFIAIKFRNKGILLTPVYFSIPIPILLHLVKDEDLRDKLASYFFMLFFPYSIYLIVSLFLNFNLTVR